jgi:dihydrodipicolinate synthase/N-acetylneuraminate lyase
MKLLGGDTGEVRLPLWPLEAAGEERIRQALQTYGLVGEKSGGSTNRRDFI